MEYKDYYKTLGVARDANEHDIKRAYRKLARKYHPDVSKEANAEEHFKEVQEAYEVLKDPKKREAYDHLGQNWKSGQEFRPPPGWQSYADIDSGAYDDIDHMGFSDFFASIFGRDIKGGQGRVHVRRGEVNRRGSDEYAKITITLEEAYHGATKTIHLKEPDREHPQENKTRILKVNIPKGVASGQQLRLSQQGAPGLGAGPAGDLYLEIFIQPHRLFSLQDHDVYLTLPITPWEAALGAKVMVPTLGGAVEMKIAANSQAGQKFRLKGRGLQMKEGMGDQYVLLQIVTPPVQTDAQRTLYEKMAHEMPFDPRKGLIN